jgi:hypothetical protein
MPDACPRRCLPHALDHVRVLYRTRRWRGEEEAARGKGQVWVVSYPLLPLHVNRRVAEQSGDKDPSRYCLTLEEMIENEYPVPSYMADIFQKPEGWVETPLPPPTNEDATPKQPSRILSVDCEMVSS